MNRPRALLTSATLFAVVAASGYADAQPKKPKDGVPFDRTTAATVLSSVDLSKCRSTIVPRGEGHIVVKFTPTGSASEALVDKGPLVGTPIAKCIAKEFNKAKVPAFAGETVQVGKSFRFE